MRKLICDKRPEQMKMPFALWTREAVRQLVLERFGIGQHEDGWYGTKRKNATRYVKSKTCDVLRHGKRYGTNWANVIGERSDRIEVFYLPSYSPELNPDERLNADLKHAITTQVPARTREHLKRKTADHMKLIESSPDRVIAYFGDPRVNYAANHK